MLRRSEAAELDCRLTARLPGQIGSVAMFCCRCDDNIDVIDFRLQTSRFQQHRSSLMLPRRQRRWRLSLGSAAAHVQVRPALHADVARGQGRFGDFDLLMRDCKQAHPSTAAASLPSQN